MTIDIIIKHPGKDAEVKKIDPNKSLEALQGIVGGYIETVSIGSNLLLICNEDGRLKKLPPNVFIGYQLIRGSIAIVGVGNEDFKGLSDSKIRTTLPAINRCSVPLDMFPNL